MLSALSAQSPLGQATYGPGLPARPPRLKRVSHCPVDAGGVEAEWVEACVATSDQPTLVYFHGGPRITGDAESGRRRAGTLAVATGARVLSVTCVAVDDGVAAYVWLLGEGVDLDTTTFVCDAAGGDRAGAVLQAARDRKLPLPGRASIHC
jgi:monoterpene epsilon-lactone hydrolase